MRAGIFGGSFDPVHKGHIKLAEYAAERLELDRLFIVPAFLSPGKNGGGASADDRLKMCRLAFSDPRFTVLGIEADRGGKSYTADTVCEIKRLYPEDEYFLVLGADQLYNFDRWRNYRQILAETVLFAVPRNGEYGSDDLERRADERLRPFGRCIIADFEPEKISSTEIRGLIKSGADASEFLAESVYAYIKSRGLYK